jgi:hypothetical protein
MEYDVKFRRIFVRSRGNAVDGGTRYRLEDGWVGVRVTGRVQTGSGDHQASMEWVSWILSSAAVAGARS